MADESHPLSGEIHFGLGFLQPVVPKDGMIGFCIGDDHTDPNDLCTKLYRYFTNFSQRGTSLSIGNHQGGCGFLINLPSKSINKVLGDDADSSSCVDDC